ncbi:energy transducer TonB [Chitinophaga sp. Hz27]|uniref:energy transducer TonB n=1 Tax=Chitinophaga sp. Hz27 TaxID=3347169 RepID=UPI0035D64A28
MGVRICNMLMIVWLGLCLSSFNKTDKSLRLIQEDSIYTILPKPPHFPGGDELLGKYISLHARLPKQDCPQGTFHISFVVRKDGKLTDIKIYGKAPESYTSSDSAIVKMIADMPDWIPGETGGKKVACQFFIPLHICMTQE